MKVAFYTLGCKLNFSETSAIARQFEEAGFEKVDFSEASDVYVVNTCSVTEQANRKCRQIIRKALKNNPAGYVIVVGCYAQLKPQEIAEIPGVDLVLGAGEKFNILSLVDRFEKTNHACVFNSKIGEVDSFVDAYSLNERSRSFLKIQDGCDYKCSFCTIPQARGKSRSDSLENILQNARSIAAHGKREIVLTGVNIGDYGTDQPGTFLDVIKALDEIDGIDRFRISSIEPNLLNREIIEFVAGSKRFMPHFHIPLQSGHNEILKAMRRRYQRELYADRVATIREFMPDACIGVDVIVGFPGETKEHFLETYRFLNELDISYLHVFPYSERENTHALSLEGVVNKGERFERGRMLNILSDKKRRAFYQQFEGQKRPVLFEGRSQNGEIYGFTDNYIKVVSSHDPTLINAIQDCFLLEINSNGQMLSQPIPTEITSSPTV